MTANPDDDEFEVLSDRETTSARAVRATVFGLICPPILIYAVGLLLKAYFMPCKLEGRRRAHLVWVSCLAGIVVLFLIGGVIVFFRGPPGIADELRTLNHPEVLVGTWEGVYAAKEGDIRLFMRLRRNGGLEYRESGPVSKQYTGAWAYDNHTFLVCYDQADRDDDPMKGRLMRFDTEGISDNEMYLRFGRDKVRMVRTK